jgi:hypothetical protein
VTETFAFGRCVVFLKLSVQSESGDTDA